MSKHTILFIYECRCYLLYLRDVLMLFGLAHNYFASRNSTPEKLTNKTCQSDELSITITLHFYTI